MIRILDKLIKSTNNLDYISKNIKNLSRETPVKRIFDTINKFSSTSEIRYVGGCIRKIIKKEKVNDIDLATNLNPDEVSQALKDAQIDFYNTGVEHGTITAIINNYKFEITSLREDIKTDGRRAEVKFTLDWKRDALRRDFTINSIYSDIEGNLFDPLGGKNDLEKGIVKFIGSPEKRIKEDYLRILRYLRFFHDYSNHKHDTKIINVIKKNIQGISSLSKDRLLDELKKYVKSNILTKLSRDKFSLELLNYIFPEIKNIKLLSKLDDFRKFKIMEEDFIFILSLLIIDGSDNADYFIYKFNISKKDQKRLKIIDIFYKEKISAKSFSEKNLNNVFYYSGKEAVIDILSYRLFFLKKIDKKFLNLIDKFRSKNLPVIPVNAKYLMQNFKIPEGKELGEKLKFIEKEWVNNNFELTDHQINKIINN